MKSGCAWLFSVWQDIIDKKNGSHFKVKNVFHETKYIFYTVNFQAKDRVLHLVNWIKPLWTPTFERNGNVNGSHQMWCD